jgi:hypothetical protein
MPLETLVKDSAGRTYINSLRRYVRGGILVPQSSQAIVKVPLAGASSSPGVSDPVNLEGPQDGDCEIISLLGGQGISNYGTGTVSSAAAVFTGVGTSFTRELQVGDTVVLNGETVTVLSIASDTQFTATGAPGTAASGSNFAYYTPIDADVRDRMCVEMMDYGHRRILTNKPIPVKHVFGDYQKPSFIAQRLLLQKQQTMSFKFFNYSTTKRGSFSMAAGHSKWQDEALKRNDVERYMALLKQHNIICYPFWLTLDETCSLNASESKLRFMSNTKDQLLVLFNSYGHMITTSTLVEPLRFVIDETRTGRSLSNQPLTMDTFCGSAQEPFQLDAPLFLAPLHKLRINFQNMDSRTTVDAFMTFHGVGVYLGQSGLMDADIVGAARSLYAQMGS